MAKAKKCPKHHIDVAVRLPMAVIAHYEQVAKLAGVTVNDALNVAVAASLVKFDPGFSENGSGKQP